MWKLSTFAAMTAAFCVLALAVPAHAVTFVFKGDGGLYDAPTGNVSFDCGTVGTDLCTTDPSLGFTYDKGGIVFTATAFMSGDPTLLIQDIFPDNSGLGAFSEDDVENDQTQFDSGESILFEFDDEVYLTNIEFNAGNDVNCSTPGPEGPCGDFDLYIDGMFFATITAEDLITQVFVGATFLFEAVTEGAGFAIAQFDVSDIPVPAALPLLLTGLGGLGFAARRRKKAV